jgi:hypothetical protein
VPAPHLDLPLRKNRRVVPATHRLVLLRALLAAVVVEEAAVEGAVAAAVGEVARQRDRVPLLAVQAGVGVEVVVLLHLAREFDGRLQYRTCQLTQLLHATVRIPSSI